MEREGGGEAKEIRKERRWGGGRDGRGTRREGKEAGKGRRCGIK